MYLYLLYILFFTLPEAKEAEEAVKIWEFFWEWSQQCARNCLIFLCSRYAMGQNGSADSSKVLTFNLLNLYDSQILFIVYLINWVHFVGKTSHSWIFIDTSCEVFDSIQYKKVLKLLSPIVLHSLVTYICKTFNYCQVFNLNLGFFSWLKISKFSILNVFVTAMFPAEYWKITINNHNNHYFFQVQHSVQT